MDRGREFWRFQFRFHRVPLFRVRLGGAVSVGSLGVGNWRLVLQSSTPPTARAGCSLQPILAGVGRTTHSQMGRHRKRGEKNLTVGEKAGASNAGRWVGVSVCLRFYGGLALVGSYIPLTSVGISPCAGHVAGVARRIPSKYLLHFLQSRCEISEG
jgi:hypothetical protein